jgi:hypothetical protein
MNLFQRFWGPDLTAKVHVYSTTNSIPQPSTHIIWFTEERSPQRVAQNDLRHLQVHQHLSTAMRIRWHASETLANFIVRIHTVKLVAKHQNRRENHGACPPDVDSEGSFLAHPAVMHGDDTLNLDAVLMKTLPDRHLSSLAARRIRWCM